MLKKLSSALLLVLALASVAAAQDVEVDRYNVTARVDPGAGVVETRAAVAIANLGQSPKQRLYFRLSKQAKVSAVSVNGAAAQFESPEDRRVSTLNQLIITPPAPLAAGARATVEVTYRIEAPDASALITIYPGEVFLLPEAVWVPMPSTMFALYGAPTAPFTLSVTGTSGAAGWQAVSAGARRFDEGNRTFTFEQSMNGLPFFVAGGYEAAVEGGAANGVKIELHLQPGLGDVVARQLADEARRMIEFFARTLGPPPADTTFRIISSARSGNLAVPGAVVVNERVFRAEVADAATLELMADAVARMWTDGRVRIRGQEGRSAQPGQPAQKGRSSAFLRDSLPRYLAALYIEDRFGKAAGRAAFERMTWSYTPVAKSARDAELGIQTPLVATYSAAVLNKGPLVFRYIAETVGRDKFIGALRAVFAGPPTKVVLVDDLRAALVREAPAVERIFQQWLDTIVEPDIVVGVPMTTDRPGVYRINLRNLGDGQVSVPLLLVTESGKRTTQTVEVPSEDLTSVEVQSAEKIAAVEIDPDKLIIQTDYDNDAKPARPSSQTLFNDGAAALTRGEHAQAEAKFREAVRIDPENALLHAYLARALAAQNKADEAAAAAGAALKIEPPIGAARAWAHIALGQIALARGQNAEAVGYLRRAVAEAADEPAQFASRELLVKAERAAGQVAAPDESVRTFIARLDSLLQKPASDQLFAIISRNNLKRFVTGLTVNPPQAWKTEILRVVPLEANRVEVDVALSVTQAGRQQTGTAVYVLLRGGSGWVLEDVQLFNVK